MTQSEETAFDAEKIEIQSISMLKGQVESSEDFDMTKVTGHKSQTSLEMLFNLEQKLIKTEFSVSITTQSKKLKNDLAKANFEFVFLYFVENLEEMTKLDGNNLVEIESILENSIAGITYSTVRGMLFTRLQGTPLENFILPVINPVNLRKD